MLFRSAKWSQFGGTSAAAPQWAALAAIVDQGRALSDLGSLDGRTQLLPALYKLASADFHDIASGGSTGSPSYPATAGYDLVTGRGTPIANLVIADLAAWGTSSTPASPTLAAPTNVTVRSITKTSVQVSWTAAAGATGYKVLMSDGTTTSVLANVGPNTTSVKVSGLTRGATYAFAVTAYNATSSATSAWVSNTMPAMLQVTAPQNVAFRGTYSSGGTLTWSAAGNATGYVVYALDVGSRQRVSAWVDASSTSITVSGLRAGRVYQFQVVAINDDSSAASDSLTLAFAAAAGAAADNVSPSPGRRC